MNIRKQIQDIQDSAVNDPRFKNNEEIEVTKDDAAFVNKLFNSILPQFPAWRQTCPTEDDLNRLKMAWSKAIKRNMIKTGKQLNVKAGLLACEESESDWLPSVGKFIKWCDQSNDLIPLAERAFKIFSAPTWGQKQTCNVGQMVVAEHGFKLKNMKASDCEKAFTELYLKCAEDNPIKHLDAFAVEDMTTCSYEERKRATERESRTDEENQARDKAGMESFLKQFGSIKKDKPVEQPKKEAKGIQQGGLKQYAKTPAQLEKEKQRQLAMIKGVK